MAEAEADKWMTDDLRVALERRGHDFNGPIMPEFDKTVQYIPVFATCIVPEGYLRSLSFFAQLQAFCHFLPIFPQKGDDTKEAILARVPQMTARDLTIGVAFEDWEANDIWDFYDENLRPSENMREAHHKAMFSSFTIVVITEDCLDQANPDIIIYTDAPDQADDMSCLQPKRNTNSADPREFIPIERDEHNWPIHWPEPTLRGARISLDDGPLIAREIEGLRCTRTEALSHGNRLLIMSQGLGGAWGRFGDYAPQEARRFKWAALAGIFGRVEVSERSGAGEKDEAAGEKAS